MPPSHRDILCSMLWKLCRRHGWGAPITEDGLIDLALQPSDQGLGRKLLPHLESEPYIIYQRGKGYLIKNDPKSQAQAAYRLKNTCSYSEFQIEHTLSRFEQAGGFNAYDEKTVMAGLPSW